MTLPPAFINTFTVATCPFDDATNAEEGYDSKAIKPMYEFKGKRPVCSRANACEPKYACLGGDVCLEGYTKYYEHFFVKSFILLRAQSNDSKR